MKGVHEEMPMKVTVIVPTYKREVFFLSRAVNSVLNQTYKEIELIVIDDSPDTYEKRLEISDYMKKIVESDSRVLYLVNEKNMGGSLTSHFLTMMMSISPKK